MTVEDRLENLEHENRTLKLVLLALGALLAFGAVEATKLVESIRGLEEASRVEAAAIPDVVKARAFHVVGENGTALVKLEDTYGVGLGYGGTLTIMNGKGQRLVMIGQTVDGLAGTITTLSEKWMHQLVDIGVDGAGSGKVTIFDPSGRPIGSLHPRH